MADSSTQSSESTTTAAHEPSAPSFWLNFLGVVGTIAIFLIIVLIVYIYTRPPVEVEINQLREERRHDIEATQQRLLSEVRYVEGTDQAFVTMPIEEAMRLTVQRIRQNQQAGEAWRPPLQDPEAASSSATPAPSEASAPEESSADSAENDS